MRKANWYLFVWGVLAITFVWASAELFTSAHEYTVDLKAEAILDCSVLRTQHGHRKEVIC